MVSKITQVKITGTVDASGNIDVTKNRVVRGNIKKVQVIRPDNTVEVDLKTDEKVPQTILNLAAGTSNVTVYPRVILQDNTNSNITYDGTNEIYGEYTVFGNLNLVCASGTENDTVTVYVLVEEY